MKHICLSLLKTIQDYDDAINAADYAQGEWNWTQNLWYNISNIYECLGAEFYWAVKIGGLMGIRWVV